jgi:hypothetical protein
VSIIDMNFNQYINCNHPCNICHMVRVIGDVYLYIIIFSHIVHLMSHQTFTIINSLVPYCMS